ncbi:MAG: LPS export ABC transporter permease LptG [Desulfuromonadaceae bacterium]|nr:LPS export ABC transporter permease LptG [Desulfuromonadaceae bacterium]
MTILQRYLLGTFARIMALSLSSFCGVYLLIDFFGRVDNFLEHSAPASLYLLYFGAKTPLILSQVLPLAVLMGIFLTLGGFSKTNELIAMRAGGVGLPRIIMPIMLIAGLIGIGHFLLNEYVVPVGVKKFNHVMRVEVKGKTAALGKRQNIWFRDRDTMYHIDFSGNDNTLLYGVSIYELTAAFEHRRSIKAAQLVFNENSWQAQDALIREFNPATELLEREFYTKQIPIALNKTPDDFSSTENEAEELSYAELHDISNQLEKAGLNNTKYRVDMHAKLAQPLVSLIMALLGIPFALQKSRNINLGLGISICIMTGMAYFVTQSTLVAFGYAEILPPVLAAWSANIIFLLLSIVLILSTRE